MSFTYGRCSFLVLGDRFNVCRVNPTMANGVEFRMSGKPDNGKWSGISHVGYNRHAANTLKILMSGKTDNGK